MTNQVVNVQQQAQNPVQQPAQGGQARSSATTSYPPTNSTASTVRRIYGIPASAMSSNSSVRMVSNGEMFDDGKIVILDSGSDVSLLPHDLGREIDSPADEAHVRLRDCEGKELQVAKVRTASIVVENEDGNQAELEMQFVVSESVKSCILSLGQLYRAGWSVQQNDDGPTLESPENFSSTSLLSAQCSCNPR
jgi:hypothetical protein